MTLFMIHLKAIYIFKQVQWLHRYECLVPSSDNSCALFKRLYHLSPSSSLDHFPKNKLFSYNIHIVFGTVLPFHFNLFTFFLLVILVVTPGSLRRLRVEFLLHSALEGEHLLLGLCLLGGVDVVIHLYLEG